MSRSSEFRTTELRPGMDVFRLDGGHIGTVIRVLPGPEHSVAGDPDHSEAPEHRQFDGESSGPAPTREVGNFGPETQAPENFYGSRTVYGESLGQGEIVVGTFLGMFRRRRISFEQIQTVSMERVILRQTGTDSL